MLYNDDCKIWFGSVSQRESAEVQGCEIYTLLSIEKSQDAPNSFDHHDRP